MGSRNLIVRSGATLAAAGLLVGGALAGAAYAGGPQSGAAPESVHPVAQPAAATDCAKPADAKLKDQDYEDDQLPWRRSGDEEVVIRFDTSKVKKAEYLDNLKKAVAAWDVSPCVKPVLVDSCPEKNCVTIGLDDEGDDGDDGNFDAIEKNGFTVGGHISYYTDELDGESAVERLNVVTHEMGHAIGLRHRATKGVLMYADTNKTTQPDDTDFHNLQVLYGDQGSDD